MTENQVVESSNLVLLQYCVGYSKSFVCLYKLYNDLAVPNWYCWDFDGDHMEFIDQVGKN